MPGLIANLSLAVFWSLVSAARLDFRQDVTLVGLDLPLLDQEFFGGIPYVQPPVGDLRFRPPIPLDDDWFSATEFDAQNFGLACIQTSVPVNTTDEDCLTLNVWRPSNTSLSDPLPVVVFIHGGGFKGGASSLYNGSAVVSQSKNRGTPIVLASFNYRLGAFGFPQGQEAELRGALNLGLHDQLSALQWIQNNIGYFGGDPKQVTLWGQSAGAISISMLYLNSGLENYARSAILESGSAGANSVFNATRRELDWQNLVSFVPECASAANTFGTFPCLQNANATDILAAMVNASALAGEHFPFSPVIDGPLGIIPDIPSRLITQGRFARLPFISGDNLDEGTIFIDSTLNETSTIQTTMYSQAMTVPVAATTLNATIDEILTLYPDDASQGSPFFTGNATFGRDPQYKRYAAIFGDQSFHSQRRFWMQQASGFGLPVFGYLFQDPSAIISPGTIPSARPQAILGVCHASELPYTFGNLLNATASAAELSAQMIDYWLSFATGLSPNDGLGSDRIVWRRYDNSNPTIIQLDSLNMTIIPDDYRSDQIAYINSVHDIFNV